MADSKIEEVTSFVNAEKGKRKFKQSVELAINFKGIDFSKQDNRINLDVLLPHERGKSKQIAVFASDKDLIAKAEKSGITVFNADEINSIATDSVRMNSLLKYDMFAQPSLLPSIAKALGQFLGPRNSMPKPLLGNINFNDILTQAGKKIQLRSRGKYLPTVHCMIATEDMTPKDIYENASEVVSAVSKKVGQNRIRSVYLKLSMSKPMRFM
jgi:large subunit ribosomal protein L1